MQLIDLGWDSFFNNSFEPYKKQGLSAMRISRENRGKYIACGEHGKFTCEISGKFRFEADTKDKFPAVGDWVAASIRQDEGTATIHAILPRKSGFSRKIAGQTTESQVLAANIDIVFIVCGLDLNFNLRRIERYLSMALESGAVPVILLNKTDICPEAEIRKNEVEAIAPGTDIYNISATQKTGLEFFHKYINKGKTASFLGSSGVGKSTIINSLLGTDRLKVNEVSELGSRGRHTTSFRELIMLPDGGMVIDTPGMRELQVWGEEKGMKQVFDDIEELALKCKFRNCSHQSEPGCAVQKAIHNETLEPNRLKSFLKLKREYEYLASRQIMKHSAIEKAHWKKISILARNLKKRSD